MATINVSGRTQLLSALKTAHAGDTLSLAGGNYGSVTVPSSANHGAVTIRSASDGNQAVFTKLIASRVSNFTVDNVKFDGPGGAGGGLGLLINYSTNVKVLNSDFTDFKFGSFLYEIKGLTVSNNTYTRMYEDAMNFTDIQGGTISGNVYRESGSQPGYSHKDFIQFWTNAGNNQAASTNVKIIGNSFYSKDNQTHGIFINNEWHGQKYQNIYIANNYLKSSQTHGITVNYADGLQILNNTVIKDGSGTPTINVTPDSTHVKIIGNTAPNIADKGNSTWTVSGNKETIPNAYLWTAGLSGSTVNNTGGTSGSTTSAAATTAAATTAETTAASTTKASSSLDIGNGKADDFVFKGTAVTGAKTNVLSHVDFSEHDEIVFVGYDKGTLSGHGGGNSLVVDLAGTYARADSVADLKELVSYSKAIDAKVSGDILTVTIHQHAGTQTLVLDGLGHEYQDSFALL